MRCSVICLAPICTLREHRDEEFTRRRHPDRNEFLIHTDLARGIQERRPPTRLRASHTQTSDGRKHGARASLEGVTAILRGLASQTKISRSGGYFRNVLDRSGVSMSIKRQRRQGPPDPGYQIANPTLMVKNLLRPRLGHNPPQGANKRWCS